MTSFADLSAFQRDLLVLLAADPGASGMDVRPELEDRHGKRIASSQLYNNIGRLVEEGLVRKESVDGRTNALYLTDAGEDALDTHLDWMNKQFQS